MTRNGPPLRGNRAQRAVGEQFGILPQAPKRWGRVVVDRTTEPDDRVSERGVHCRRGARLACQSFQEFDVVAATGHTQGHDQLILRLPGASVQHFTFERSANLGCCRRVGECTQPFGTAPSPRRERICQ
ncbi:hypothetical protein [Nocardia sp. NPDC004604]|uniref:hypothetical protein n=1 Tax=Nocardia sp. NPDC004604 TaxID=3157013 RepID=UPI0033A313B6